MAFHDPARNTQNWWVWGGGLIALIAIVTAVAYGFDLVGASETAPAAVTAPSE